MKNSRYLGLLHFKKRANKKLKNVYDTNENSFNIIIINHIIFNEKTRLVALFKEHLVSDDNSEFLRRLFLLNKILFNRREYLSYYGDDRLLLEVFKIIS